ncbi:Histone-lysine N-methyltransferase SETMAR, partial [Ooceraea biroi]
KGKNAVQARTKLCAVYGEDVLSERQCQNWFSKFRTGNFDLKDAPRSGRPIKADDEKIKALVDANRRITTREIAEKLNLSNSTVYDHLKRLGFVSKLDIWVPHNLKEIDLIRRITICDSLPHTSLVTRQLLQLGWDVLPHPPYSSDLAPSDYHLFRSLQNSLNNVNFDSNEGVKNHLLQFFVNKEKDFYERGILKLPEIWRKVVEQNGQYITEYNFF